MDFDSAAESVIGLAQEFISLVRQLDPTWTRAFWRFESEELRYGSNASYVSPNGVFLVPALKQRVAIDALNEMGRKLWASEPDSAKRFCVCLLLVDSNFSYEIKFERQDLSKWRITKLDGATGLPAGL